MDTMKVILVISVVVILVGLSLIMPKDQAEAYHGRPSRFPEPRAEETGATLPPYFFANRNR